jgi:hypothetical protein
MCKVWLLGWLVLGRGSNFEACIAPIANSLKHVILKAVLTKACNYILINKLYIFAKK